MRNHLANLASWKLGVVVFEASLQGRLSLGFGRIQDCQDQDARLVAPLTISPWFAALRASLRLGALAGSTSRAMLPNARHMRFSHQV